MSYILVFVLLLSNGEYRVAQEGRPAAVVFDNKRDCDKQGVLRMEQAEGQVPWVMPLCVPVPTPGQ